MNNVKQQKDEELLNLMRENIHLSHSLQEATENLQLYKAEFLQNIDDWQEKYNALQEKVREELTHKEKIWDGTLRKLKEKLKKKEKEKEQKQNIEQEEKVRLHRRLSALTNQLEHLTEMVSECHKAWQTYDAVQEKLEEEEKERRGTTGSP